MLHQGIILLGLVASAWLSASLMPDMNTPQIWLPAGLALAMILQGGIKQLPVVSLGLAGGYLICKLSVLMALSSTLLMTLALLASLTLHDSRWHFPSNINTLKATLRFLYYPVLLLAPASAVVAYLNSHSPLAAFYWYQATLLGAVIASPILLMWPERESCVQRLSHRQLLSPLILSAIVINSLTYHPGAGLIGEFHVELLLIPMTIWAAATFGMSGAIFINSFNVIALLIGMAVFPINEALAPIRFIPFLVLNSISALVLGAFQSEKEQGHRDLKKSTLMLQQIINAVPHFIYVKNRKGRILIANQSLSEAYGVSVEHMLDQGHAQFHGKQSELVAFTAVEQRCISSRETQHSDNEFFTTPDGKTQILQSIRTPIMLDDTETGCVVVSVDMTEMKRNEQKIKRYQIGLENMVKARTSELQSEKSKVENYLNTANSIMMALDRLGRIRMFNRKGCEALGYDSNSTLLGNHFIEHLLPLTEQERVQGIFDAAINGFLSDHSLLICQVRHRHLEPRSIEWQITPLRDSHNHITGLLCSGQDISERLLAQDQIRTLSQAVEQSPNMVIVTNSNGEIEYVNPRFLQTTGYEREEVIGRNPRFLSSGNTPAENFQHLWYNLSHGKEWRGEFCNRKKNGDTYWVHALLSPIRDDQGNVSHFLALQEDISLRKDYERQLQIQATIDNLTGLPNRSLAFDRLHQAINYAQKSKNLCSVIFLDLDNFKMINDSLSHAAGDQLLIAAAKRLKSMLKPTDTIARFGGDEFIIILTELEDMTDIEIMAERILDTFNQPFRIQSHELTVSCSMGLTVYPNDGESSQILIRNADAAMYRAKDNGRNSYAFFTREMNDQMIRRMHLEEGLRQALERNELSLVFQPQVDPLSGHITGAEALIRWQHPEMGAISPLDFIPLAESNGMIKSIGAWVLHEACQQASRWHDIAPIRISVNVSSRQLKDPAFVSHVRGCLLQHQLSQELLELEITESLLLENDKDTLDALREIRQMGIGLALDDFGTGYSSLSYLKHLPFTALKIDRAFIADLFVDDEDTALIDAIIALSRSLGLTIIAEGVENQEQFDYLRDHRVHLIQGYYTGKPMSAEAFENLLTQQAGKNKSRSTS